MTSLEPRDAERGGSRIVVYLDDVTEAEVQQLADAIADLCVKSERSAFRDDDLLRCVIALEGYRWPETPEEFVQQAGEAASGLILPGLELPDDGIPPTASCVD